MKKIFILTGEPSGDKLASEVINDLNKITIMNKYIFFNSIFFLKFPLFDILFYTLNIV